MRVQAHKQGQDKKCQALLWLSREEAGVQEEGLEQHFLLPRVWGQKLYLFLSLSHTANQSSKDPGAISRIQAQISQFTFFQSKGWKVDFHTFPGTQNTWIEQSDTREVKWQKAFWSTLQNLSAAESQKVKDISNGLLYFPFFHSLKAVLSNLAAFYFQSINSSAGV